MCCGLCKGRARATPFKKYGGWDVKLFGRPPPPPYFIFRGAPPPYIPASTHHGTDVVFIPGEPPTTQIQ